jgi:hypothetical protein
VITDKRRAAALLRARRERPRGRRAAEQRDELATFQLTSATIRYAAHAQLAQERAARRGG